MFAKKIRFYSLKPLFQKNKYPVQINNLKRYGYFHISQKIYFMYLFFIENVMFQK